MLNIRFVILLFIIKIAEPYRYQCPRNYTLIYRPNFYCKAKCESLPDASCQRLTRERRQCICAVGYALDKRNKCIKLEDCQPYSIRTTTIKPRCYKNMIFSKCPSKCQPTCTNKLPICTKDCGKPKCICKKGYVLHRKRCIKETRCTMISTTTKKPIKPCPLNMIWNNCPMKCEKHCFETENVVPCFVGVCQNPRCMCQKGYVLHGSRCIDMDECNRLKTLRPILK
uniref:TIL domain-containing protein n=1 Tax=Parastrongyloides trichosuri TaxID=131310 RepID=A0A0N4ZPL2_PARTI